MKLEYKITIIILTIILILGFTAMLKNFETEKQELIVVHCPTMNIHIKDIEGSLLKIRY